MYLIAISYSSLLCGNAAGFSVGAAESFYTFSKAPIKTNSECAKRCTHLQELVFNNKLFQNAILL